jgi:hypothetical protein
MDNKIQQGLEWLDKEMKKDQMDILNHKKKLISEIVKIDKSKMFVPPIKEKVSFLDKILKIIGYGKKG